MKLISSDLYAEKIKMMKYKPEALKLPTHVKNIIIDNNLVNMNNVDERAKLFLQQLFHRRLKSNTVTRYFNKVKPMLFPDTNIAPNSFVFDNAYIRPIQCRGNNLEKIKTFINYCKYQVPDTCEYKWPIMISAYSGLRLSEVCRVKMSHLSMLTKEKPIIPLKRKNNKDWEVIYYDEFQSIIKDVIQNNYKAYSLFKEKDIDSKLFPYSTQSLHLKVKEFYFYANGQPAPIGFGLHSVRYYLATMLYEETNKIEIAQVLLGHVKQRVTERYIKQNISKRNRELNLLSQRVGLYSNIKKLIQK